jgi:hypothetical protein
MERIEFYSWIFKVGVTSTTKYKNTAAEYCIEIYQTLDLVVFMAVGIRVKGF